jgi:hypothetical protein
MGPAAPFPRKGTPDYEGLRERVLRVFFQEGCEELLAVGLMEVRLCWILVGRQVGGCCAWLPWTETRPNQPRHVTTFQPSDTE